MALACGDLEVELDELDGGAVGLDYLAGEIVEGGQTELVVGALGLDGAGGLDLVVLEAAVRAGEGHDYYFAEVGDLGEEEAGDALSGFVY